MYHCCSLTMGYLSSGSMSASNSLTSSYSLLVSMVAMNLAVASSCSLFMSMGSNGEGIISRLGSSLIVHASGSILFHRFESFIEQLMFFIVCAATIYVVQFSSVHL